MKRISVLIADDHPVLRAGLRALLDLEPDLEIVGEAVDGREAVLLASKLKPDMVVMDVSMPHLDGIEATRKIHDEQSGTKILILSSHSEMSCLSLAAEAGAAGFLLKQDAPRSLPAAIRVICGGGTYLSPVLSTQKSLKKRPGIAQGKSSNSIPPPLTSREKEVLQGIAEGMTNKELALDLGISGKTLEKHRKKVMKKLAINDAAVLTHYAIASGIIECGLNLSGN